MGSYCFMGVEFHCYKMKGVMETNSGDGHTLQMYLIPLNYILKNVSVGKFYVYFATIKRGGK